MKKLFFSVSFYLLFSTLLGETTKPSVFVIPPIIKGEISDIQIKFLLTTLDDSLSNYFDVSTPPQNKSGECLTGCNFFQLEVEENDGDSQLTLRSKSDEYSKKETELCVSCNTTELNDILKNLVENMVKGKKEENNFAEKKLNKGVLFLRSVNGKFRWFKNGDENKDGRYEGGILNGIPSNDGTLTWPDGEKYTGEWKDGRKNGQGALIFFSGNKYEGEFKDGKYHGRGLFTWSDSDKYEGEFKDGTKHGHGIYIQTDGSKYFGEFKNGFKNGQGTLTYGKGEFEGDLYVGKFTNGKKHGHGIYTQSDGSKYVGEFKNGFKNGQGTLTFGKGEFEGDLYVGEFTNDKINGNGTYTSSNGDKYSGEFRNGLKNGQGKITYGGEIFKGDTFEGEFKNDKINGNGTYTSSNGDKYSGEFRNGLKNGQGTFTYGIGKFEGDMYEGEFKDDRKQGQGKYNYANGDIYSGEYKNDKKHGKGNFSWNNGDKYVGDYYNGNIRGVGTKSFFDGRKYVGEWLNGEFHGRGKFISPGGESYDGQWQSGEYSGQGTYIFGDGNWKGDKYEGEYKNGKREGKGTYTFSDGKKYSGNFKNGKMHGQGILTSAEGDKYEGKWNDGKYWDILIYEKDGNIAGEYVDGVKIKLLDTVNRCRDLKTHTLCLSFKASAPPASPQPWGEISKYSPEVFCASDLSAGICDRVTTALLAATNEWGNYGPLEYWVLGTEEQAGKALSDAFCSRRKKRGNIEKARCLKRQNNEGDYGFEYYRKVGAEALASGEPKQDAARNGKRSWGIHFFTSSLPVGFTDLFNVPGIEEQKIIFHEYFHAVQISHIKTRNRHKREEKGNHIWFHEGGAEYMAWVGLINSGVQETGNMGGKNQFYPIENMRWKMEGGKIGLNSVCPGTSLWDIDYGSSCTNVAYDLGSWAHAYLANKFGPNILLDKFYPNLEELGWEGAFERAYGMSIEDFYKEFNKFLKLPLAEQLEILPSSFKTN